MRAHLLFGLSLFAFTHCVGFQARYHRVAPNETISEIASQYAVPEDVLLTHNASKLKEGLTPGVKLYIPVLTPTDELPFSKKSRSVKVANRVSRNQASLVSDDSSASLSPVFFWPVQGIVTSGYGKRRSKIHEGIDIAAASGTSVRASRSGHVIYAGSKIKGYGNMVILRHADKFSTVYAHLSTMEVKKGQFVARGQILGRVGNTGKSTRPHLHFEVRSHTVAQDPLLYLQGQFAANRIQKK